MAINRLLGEFSWFKNEAFLTAILLSVFSRMRRLIWGLSVEDGLRAYARMLNTLDIEAFAPLIADDFRYASQRCWTR